MINGVTQNMDNRIGDIFENAAIEFDLLPGQLEMNFFPLLARQVTHQTRKPFRNKGKRQHARFKNLIAQVTQQCGQLVE